MKTYLHFSGAHWEKSLRLELTCDSNVGCILRSPGHQMNTAPRDSKSYCLFGRKSHLSDKLVWVTTTVDLYHRTGNVRCVIHMSHDTPCHNVVWLSRRKRDDTGTPKNKNIHICMWSKVDGVLIGDIPGYFYSILVQFVHLETAGGWRWRYSGVFT